MIHQKKETLSRFLSSGVAGGIIDTLIPLLSYLISANPA